MNKFLLSALLASAAILPATTALAADIDVPPPPPVEELRPATYDWTGFNVGVFVAANAVDGHYDATPICDDPATPAIETCTIVDPEMSGIGYAFGVKGGFDYQMGDIVLGIMGDWAMGGKIADNDDPSEATWLKVDNMGTLRARAGWALDDTLLYASAGVALAEMEFGGLVGPGAVADSHTDWTTGLALGGGIEHAITDNLSVSLDYMYVDFQDSKHYLTDGAGAGGTVDMKYNAFHTIRAGMSYRF